MLDLTNWESASERGPSPMCHTQTLALSAPPEPGTDCGAGRPPPPLVTIHQNPHLGEKRASCSLFVFENFVPPALYFPLFSRSV